MASNQAQVSSDPITGRPFSPGLRYSTGCDVEPQTTKQSALCSDPVPESPYQIFSRSSSPGLRYSTGCDVEPDFSKLQQEIESFCDIPIHILAKVQKYFLTTVPSPGKIFSINLVSEPSPVHSSPSDVFALLEDIAIPDHVGIPLQEYFLNRRANPEQFPKYVGVRITQEDARLYENVLGCCERGCLDEVAKEGASETTGPDSRESRAEALDGIIKLEFGEDSGGEVSLDLESVSNMHPRKSSANDVQEEEGSGGGAPEPGV